MVWQATKTATSASLGTHSIGPVPAMPGLFTSPAIPAAGIVSGIGRPGPAGAVGGVIAGRRLRGPSATKGIFTAWW